MVKAIYDYDAVEDGELSFKAGDVIKVEESDDENWWKGILKGSKGMFPSNYVSKIY